MAVTHLAGNRVVVGNYAIQRCLLCGEMLDEFNAAFVAVADGSPIPELAVGGLYEIDGNHTSLIRLTESPFFASDLDVPDNCCVRRKFMKSASTGVDSSAAMLDAIYDLCDQLMHGGCLSTLDALCATWVVDKNEPANIDAVLGVLTATLPMYELLPARAFLLNRAKEVYGHELFDGL